MARSVQQKIDIGNVSSIYFSNELESGVLKGGYEDEKWRSLIYLVRQALEWLYELDPTHPDLDIIGNYLIAICKHSARAEANIVGGGSTPSIINPSRPSQLNFTVAASGTSLIDGQTSATFTQFIGYNLVLDKNGQPMTQISTAPIYYTWDKNSGILILNQAATTGDEFQITPV